MNLKNLSHPEKYKKQIFIALALTLVLDIFAHRHHPYFFWDEIPGFSIVYGFIACAAIIFVAKGLGHSFIMKREDYYD